MDGLEDQVWVNLFGECNGDYGLVLIRALFFEEGLCA